MHRSGTGNVEGHLHVDIPEHAPKEADEPDAPRMHANVSTWSVDVSN